MSAEIFSFKPIQVPCLVRPGFTFIVCLSTEEIAFLGAFQGKPYVMCPIEERDIFETINISDLVEKRVLYIEERVTGIYYLLTEVGKLLIKNFMSEITQSKTRNRTR